MIFTPYYIFALPIVIFPFPVDSCLFLFRLDSSIFLLVLLKSSAFTCLRNFFISPSTINDNLAGQNILSCRLFPFRTLNISCHSILAYKISIEKSAVSLGGSLKTDFFFVAFGTLFLCLIFASLIMLCVLVWVCLSSSCLGSSVLPVPVYVSFFRFGKFSAIVSLNTFPIFSLLLLELLLCRLACLYHSSSSQFYCKGVVWRRIRVRKLWL